MREDSEYIIPLMCKKGFLQLEPFVVKEIVMGNYTFISVEGKGGYYERFRDVLRKLPWISYSRALILVEYHPSRGPLIGEMKIITSRLPDCVFGFSKLPLSSDPDVVVVRILLSEKTKYGKDCTNEYG